MTKNDDGLSPSDKLATARLLMSRRAPYLTAALLGLVPREAPGLGTFGVTDRMVLLWDPAAAAAWSVEEVAAVLSHEVWHVLRDHAARRKALDAQPLPWNGACDAEINDDLKEGGWKLPGEPIYPSTLGCKDGLTAEEYYAALPREGAGEGSGKGKGGKGEKQPGDGQAQDGDSDKPDGAANGWCGSGAGRHLPGEPADGEGQGDADGRSQSDVARIRQEVAQAVADHVQQKGRGSMPAGWQRWAEEALRPPKIPWQQKLARAIRAACAWKAGAVDYKFSHVSRRQAGVGFGPGKPILPALRAPVPRVMCALDTSGSMGGDEVTRGLSEISGILSAVGADVEFCACDAQVHAMQPVRHWKELGALVKGGGGTDFRPVFEALARSKRRPSVLVFVTDAQGPAPDAPPAFAHVIWVVVGGSARPTGSNGHPVTWGEFIEIDN